MSGSGSQALKDAAKKSRKELEGQEKPPEHELPPLQIPKPTVKEMKAEVNVEDRYSTKYTKQTGPLPLGQTTLSVADFGGYLVYMSQSKEFAKGMCSEIEKNSYILLRYGDIYYVCKKSKDQVEVNAFGSTRAVKEYLTDENRPLNPKVKLDIDLLPAQYMHYGIISSKSAASFSQPTKGKNYDPFKDVSEEFKEESKLFIAEQSATEKVRELKYMRGKLDLKKSNEKEASDKAGKTLDEIDALLKQKKFAEAQKKAEEGIYYLTNFKNKVNYEAELVELEGQVQEAKESEEVRLTSQFTVDLEILMDKIPYQDREGRARAYKLLIDALGLTEFSSVKEDIAGLISKNAKQILELLPEEKDALVAKFNELIKLEMRGSKAQEAMVEARDALGYVPELVYLGIDTGMGARNVEFSYGEQKFTLSRMLLADYWGEGSSKGTTFAEADRVVAEKMLKEALLFNKKLGLIEGAAAKLLKEIVAAAEQDKYSIVQMPNEIAKSGKLKAMDAINNGDNLSFDQQTKLIELADSARALDVEKQVKVYNLVRAAAVEGTAKAVASAENEVNIILGKKKVVVVEATVPVQEDKKYTKMIAELDEGVKKAKEAIDAVNKEAERLTKQGYATKAEKDNFAKLIQAENAAISKMRDLSNGVAKYASEHNMPEDAQEHLTPAQAISARSQAEVTAIGNLPSSKKEKTVAVKEEPKVAPIGSGKEAGAELQLEEERPLSTLSDASLKARYNNSVTALAGLLSIKIENYRNIQELFNACKQKIKEEYVNAGKEIPEDVARAIENYKVIVAEMKRRAGTAAKAEEKPRVEPVAEKKPVEQKPEEFRLLSTEEFNKLTDHAAKFNYILSAIDYCAEKNDVAGLNSHIRLLGYFAKSETLTDEERTKADEKMAVLIYNTPNKYVFINAMNTSVLFAKTEGEKERAIDRIRRNSGRFGEDAEVQRLAKANLDKLGYVKEEAVAKAEEKPEEVAKPLAKKSRPAEETAADYIVAGDQRLDREDYETAIDWYTKAIKLTPDNAIAYYARGTAYYRKGEYENAIADYERALELEPSRTDIQGALQTAREELAKKNAPAPVEPLQGVIAAQEEGEFIGYAVPSPETTQKRKVAIKAYMDQHAKEYSTLTRVFGGAQIPTSAEGEYATASTADLYTIIASGKFILLFDFFKTRPVVKGDEEQTKMFQELFNLCVALSTDPYLSNLGIPVFGESYYRNTRTGKLSLATPENLADWEQVAMTKEGLQAYLKQEGLYYYRNTKTGRISYIDHSKERGWEIAYGLVVDGDYGKRSTIAVREIQTVLDEFYALGARFLSDVQTGKLIPDTKEYERAALAYDYSRIVDVWATVDNPKYLVTLADICLGYALSGEAVFMQSKNRIDELNLSEKGRKEFEDQVRQLAQYTEVFMSLYMNKMVVQTSLDTKVYTGNVKANRRGGHPTKGFKDEMWGIDTTGRFTIYMMLLGMEKKRKNPEPKPVKREADTPERLPRREIVPTPKEAVGKTEIKLDNGQWVATVVSLTDKSGKSVMGEVKSFEWVISEIHPDGKIYIVSSAASSEETRAGEPKPKTRGYYAYGDTTKPVKEEVLQSNGMFETKEVVYLYLYDSTGAGSQSRYTKTLVGRMIKEGDDWVLDRNYTPAGRESIDIKKYAVIDPKNNTPVLAVPALASIPGESGAITPLVNVKPIF